MSRKPICLITLAALLSLTACSPRTSKTLIEDIQQNGLVIRLHDYKQRMEYLQQKGYTERYQEEKAKMDAYNQEVIRLFRTEFDFCPVYFFMSSQTDAANKLQPVLLADDLSIDASIGYPSQVFMADYFDLLEQSSVFARPKFRVFNTKIAIAPAGRRFNFLSEEQIGLKDVRKFNDAFKNGRALYKSDFHYFLRKRKPAVE